MQGWDNMKKYNRKDFKLILSASNIVELEVLINEYFYSRYYYVADDLILHNDAKLNELKEHYFDWYDEFNSMFKIFKVKSGYKFYRYYGYAKL